MTTGEIETHLADAVVLATGGYGNAYFLSTNAMGCNVTATWRAHRRGALFANPCFTQIHPTCIPVSGEHQSKLTLMSESLRNDGRIWVPAQRGDDRHPGEIPESERDYYLERRYPAFGNLVPRDVASRAAKNVCDEGRGVGAGGLGVYLDFADAMARLGRPAIEDRYGNLFEMYAQITGEDPYRRPMRIYPAVHYTMGGLWVDYDLMATIAGLFVIGEANFSDHGANRLGASALMQGLADGYFVLPATLSDYLAAAPFEPIDASHPAVREAADTVRGRIEAPAVHRRRSHGPLLPQGTWHTSCGTTAAWNAHEAGLTRRDRADPRAQSTVLAHRRGTGENTELNQTLERAGRVADFFELGGADVRRRVAPRRVMRGPLPGRIAKPPTARRYATTTEFAYVAAWEFAGRDRSPVLHREDLDLHYVEMKQRSYK